MRAQHATPLLALLALAGCLREPDLLEATPDQGRIIDGAIPPDAAPAEAGPQPDQSVPDLGEPQDAEPQDAEPDQGEPADASQGCTPGLSETCGTDDGVCELGSRFCLADGTWSDCLDAVIPADEACNGLDDDCDGEIDEGLSRTCGSDVGACAPGTQRCVDAAWTLCEGATQPALETCNGLDDDCDGLPDEALERPCGSDEGVCVSGLERCDGGAWAGCDAAQRPNDVAEVCDGQQLDEDCDGVANEGCQCAVGESRPCGSDVGACEAGEQRCDNGAWSDCVGAVGPSAETCNGVDDDCNGVADDTPRLGEACSVGVGGCRTAGALVCLAGVADLVCNADPPAPEPETCNGRDDDCDATVDEDTPVVDHRALVAAQTQLAALASRGALIGVLDRHERGGDGEATFTLTDRGAPVGDPVVVQEANGDILIETVALIAADNISGGTDGFLAATGGPTLGSPYIDIYRLDARGQRLPGRMRIAPENDPSDVALAWTGRGLGVVWTEVGAEVSRHGRLAFAYIDAWDGPAAQPIALGLGEGFTGRPAIDWDGARFGIGFTDVDRRLASVRSAVALVSLDGEVIQERTLAAAGGGSVDLTWLPDLGGWLAAWSLSDGRLQSLRAAFFDPDEDALGAPIQIEAGVSPSQPRLAPQYVRGTLTSVGLLWQSGQLGQQSVRFSRLVPDRAGWRQAGGVHAINVTVPATAPQLAAGNGDFAAIWQDAGRIRPGTWLAVGPFGCATAD